MFDEMEKALKEGKIVALERDKKTGGIKFGGDFKDDTSAALAYSPDNPEQLVSQPRVIFIQGIYELNPRCQM